MGQHFGAQAEVALIVGLGNPGKQYEATRHNVGFRVVDLLADASGVTFQERKFRASWGAGSLEGHKIMLLKPLTFMNRSGEAVGGLLSYFGIPAERMLVVHDDLDLPLGRARLVRRGGAGGHRGVASIIQHLGHQDFSRLKMGIGRPRHGEPVEEFVLQNPYADETTVFEEMIQRGAEAVRGFLSLGIDSAMNRFNK